MSLSSPLFSICIPAYKRTDFLKRLLDSIAIQSFKDFEVIITDDSPGAEVQEFVKPYTQRFQLIYKKNPAALGTPENWNEAIRLAKGQWIKLMHDDDWLATENALMTFYQAIQENPGKTFFFSAFNNVQEDNRQDRVRLKSSKKYFLSKPARLISENVIGPPSVTLHQNNKKVWYDQKLKWLVDIDFYIYYLQTGPYHYIDEPLVNIGLNNEQVTKSSFRVASVEIPEHFRLLHQHGCQLLKIVAVYDAFWRLLRNLKVHSAASIRAAGYEGEVPFPIQQMIRFQKRIPYGLLKIGIFSKCLMLISYALSFGDKQPSK